MKTIFFSDRNRRADFLAEDIERKNGTKVSCLESFGQVFAGRQDGEEIEVFFIGEDEWKNLRQAVSFLKYCREKESVKSGDLQLRVFVFSSSEVARTVLDSVDPAGAEVCLIDPLEVTAQRLLWEHPLYESPDRFGAEELSVTLIGGGEAIPALEKTVQWCGRMKSYIMKLHVIGPDARAFETEMKLRNPGLFTQMTQENLDMQERHLITPELYLPLKLTRTLYFQADTDSEELELALDKCLASNYIIIDEGEDEKTLRTAMFVRAHFIRKHILHENYLTGGKNPVTKLPDIYVLIRDHVIADLVPDLKVEGHPADPGNDELRLIPFGMERDIYSVDAMVDTDFEKLARALFPKEFGGPESSRESAKAVMPVSTRRMLCASAVHLKYKMRDLGFVERKAEDPLYREERYPEIHEASEAEIRKKIEEMRFELAALEHQRWVIFKLCDGWIPADDDHALRYGRLLGKGIREHRQFAGKMNAACIEVSRLSGAGTKLCGNPSYFTAYDRETGAATYDTLKAVWPDMKFFALSDGEPEED